MKVFVFLFALFLSFTATATCNSGNIGSMSTSTRAVVNAECLEAHLYRECPDILIKKEVRQYLVSARKNLVQDPATEQEKVLRSCDASKDANKKELIRANYFVNHFQKMCPKTYQKMETKNMLADLKEFANGKTSNEDLLGFQKALLSCDAEQNKKILAVK